jgi:hypothetical protein
VKDKELYVNLFISNDANITIGKMKVNVSQKANFPWDGNVVITVNPERSGKFDLKIRVPGWAINEAIPGGLYNFTEKNNEPVKISVNGQIFEIAELTDGYALISRKWEQGDKVEIAIPMPVRKVIADGRVKEDNGKIAFQRGPIVYCAEWPDNNTGNVLDLVVKKDAAFTTEYVPSLLEGTQVIKTTGSQSKRTINGSIELLKEEPVTLIPYALWNNRGAGQMMVWLPDSTETSHPLPAPTIANRSKVRSSKMTGDLPAVNDQIGPANSNDHSVSYYHWWPEKNKWEWVEYDFEKPEIISKTKVYWYDDGPDGGCRVPDEWEILYLNGNIWEPVKPKTPYKITKDGWDSVEFKPVKATAVKIKVKLNSDFASGIYEWIIE